MSQRLAALLAALALLAGVLAPAAVAARADLSDIEDEVMCVQCGRPLVTSAGSAAEDQRELMQGWIDEGLTKAQIKDRLVDEYGERVLVDDRSAIAAAAPWLTAVVGLTSIGLLLRHRRQRAGRLGRGGESGAGDVGAVGRDGAGPGGAGGEGLARSTGVSAEDDARIDAELAARD